MTQVDEAMPAATALVTAMIDDDLSMLGYVIEEMVSGHEKAPLVAALAVTSTYLLDMLAQARGGTRAGTWAEAQEIIRAVRRDMA